jgi:hypothetical protein
MGFMDNLKNNAGAQLGSNLMGGQKVQLKVDTKGETKVAEAQAKIATRQAISDNLNAIRFDGSADDIGESLNSLLSMARQLGDSDSQGIGDVFKSSFSGGAKSETEKLRDAIMEKAEYGLLKLRKLDEDTAAFFQKKFDAFKPEEEEEPVQERSRGFGGLMKGFTKGFTKK